MFSIDIERDYNKRYNVEWYLGNGKIETTSAILEHEENGYLYFHYPEGGFFMVERKAIRSLQCTEFLRGLLKTK